jgi:hypothetical protein
MTAEPLRYAERLAAEVAARCDGALVAAYLHGSAALGGWVADRSDVDILLVGADDVADQAVSAVGDLLVISGPDCPGRGLECSMVSVGQARDPAPPWPFVLHVTSGAPGNRLAAGRDHPGDPDLLMHYAVCIQAGISLLGPPPRELIGPVQRPQILAYLADELAWGLANAPESYAVLNACRALAYLADGLILSKVEGGRRALEAGLAPADLLRRALDQQQARLPERPAGPDAASFVRTASASLRAAAHG